MLRHGEVTAVPPSGRPKPAVALLAARPAARLSRLAASLILPFSVVVVKERRHARLAAAVAALVEASADRLMVVGALVASKLLGPGVVAAMLDAAPRPAVAVVLAAPPRLLVTVA